MEASGAISGYEAVQIITDPYPDPGGPKTSGSGTLIKTIVFLPDPGYGEAIKLRI